MATLAVKPVPESERTSSKRWQLLISGSRVRTFARKEGAMDAMNGRASPDDIKKEYNRSGTLVDTREHTEGVGLREALFGG